MAQFKSTLVKADLTTLTTIYHYDYERLEKLRALIASYWGHFRHADSFKLKQGILNYQQWLAHYFDLSELNSAERNGKLHPRYQHPQLWRRLSDQYGYYRHIYPGEIVLFQVGDYFEFYHQLAPELLELLALKPLMANKRGALYGFPLRLLESYSQRLLKNSYSLVVISETGKQFSHVKQRLPHYTIIY